MARERCNKAGAASSINEGISERKNYGFYGPYMVGFMISKVPYMVGFMVSKFGKPMYLGCKTFNMSNKVMKFR